MLRRDRRPEEAVAPLSSPIRYRARDIRSIREELVAEAYAAIPPGGAAIVYDAMIDPGRGHNYASQPSSLDVRLETPEGYESSVAALSGLTRSRVGLRWSMSPTLSVGVCILRLVH